MSTKGVQGVTAAFMNMRKPNYATPYTAPLDLGAGGAKVTGKIDPALSHYSHVFSEISDYTIEAWVKYPQKGEYAGWMTVAEVTCGEAYNANLEVLFDRRSGVVSISTVWKADNSPRHDYQSPPFTPNLGIQSEGGYGWFHVAMTYTATGNAVQVFVNGKPPGSGQVIPSRRLLQSAAKPATPPNWDKDNQLTRNSFTCDIVAGNWHNCPAEKDCGVDDLRIWSMARDGPTIDDEKSTTMTGSENFLELFWPFDSPQSDPTQIKYVFDQTPWNTLGVLKPDSEMSGTTRVVSQVLIKDEWSPQVDDTSDEPPKSDDVQRKTALPASFGGDMAITVTMNNVLDSGIDADFHIKHAKIRLSFNTYQKEEKHDDFVSKLLQGEVTVTALVGNYDLAAGGGKVPSPQGAVEVCQGKGCLQAVGPHGSPNQLLAHTIDVHLSPEVNTLMLARMKRHEEDPSAEGDTGYLTLSITYHDKKVWTAIHQEAASLAFVSTSAELMVGVGIGNSYLDVVKKGPLTWPHVESPLKSPYSPSQILNIGTLPNGFTMEAWVLHQSGVGDAFVAAPFISLPGVFELTFVKYGTAGSPVNDVSQAAAAEPWTAQFTVFGPHEKAVAYAVSDLKSTVGGKPAYWINKGKVVGVAENGLASGKWTHVAVSYDTRLALVYINGVQQRLMLRNDNAEEYKGACEVDNTAGSNIGAYEAIVPGIPTGPLILGSELGEQQMNYLIEDVLNPTTVSAFDDVRLWGSVRTRLQIQQNMWRERPEIELPRGPFDVSDFQASVLFSIWTFNEGFKMSQNKGLPAVNPACQFPLTDAGVTATPGAGPVATAVVSTKPVWVGACGCSDSTCSSFCSKQGSCAMAQDWQDNRATGVDTGKSTPTLPSVLNRAPEGLKCRCSPLHKGLTCELGCPGAAAMKGCPANVQKLACGGIGKCDGNSGSLQCTCPKDKRGKFKNGGCACQYSCPVYNTLVCTGNGQYNPVGTNNKCVCNAGWSGIYCQFAIPMCGDPLTGNKIGQVLPAYPKDGVPSSVANKPCGGGTLDATRLSCLCKPPYYKAAGFPGGSAHYPVWSPGFDTINDRRPCCYVPGSNVLQSYGTCSLPSNAQCGNTYRDGTRAMKWVPATRFEQKPQNGVTWQKPTNDPAWYSMYNQYSQKWQSARMGSAAPTKCAKSSCLLSAEPSTCPNICQAPYCTVTSKKCPKKKSHCFPGAATLFLEGGGTVRMDEVRMHDRVAAVAQDGTVHYTALLFWGHAEANTDTEYVHLEVEAEAGEPAFGKRSTLRLTEDHFVPVATAKGLALGRITFQAHHREKRASLVELGDVLWLASHLAGSPVMPAKVIAKRTMRVAGMYNPYSAVGLLVVDGVVASEHSDSFLDPFWPASYDHHLPMAYHVVLAPFRWLSQLLPTRWAAQTQRNLNWLADLINN